MIYHFDLQCSSVCGKGERRRMVVCHSVDERNVTDDQCEGLKPLDIQICDMGSCAQGWFHSPWSRKVSSKKIFYECSNTDSQCTLFNKVCYAYGFHVAVLSLNANFSKRFMLWM